MTRPIPSWKEYKTLLLRYGFYVWVLLVCTACGGGGGGSGGANAAVSGNALSSSGTRFPALSPAPGNNAAMLSCQTNTPAPAGTITGTVLYQRVPITTSSGLNYNNIQNMPARGVVVQAVAAAGSSCSSTIVATALTNGSGQYGLNVPVDQAVCIEVRAQLYRDGTAGGPSWDVQVVDNTNAQAAYYMLGGAPATPMDNPVRDLLAGTGWSAVHNSYTSDRAAAPFAILDAVCEAIDAVVTEIPSVQLPLIKMNWSTVNKTAEGNLDQGEIGGAFYRETRYSVGGVITAIDRDIFLLGDENDETDEYDPHLINHEFGHYLISALSRSDTIGGSHYLDDRLDPRVAFDEGLATALAGITLDNTAVITDAHIYRDSFGNEQQYSFWFPINTSTSFYTVDNKGWYSEPSVYATIYNAFDATPDSFDSLNLGAGPILDVLTSNAYINSPSRLTIFTFFHVLKQQTDSSLHSAIDDLLAEENIEEVVDAFGTAESAINNNVYDDVPDPPIGLGLDLEDVEPVYLTLYENVIQGACSTDATNGVFQTPNKLSNGRFLRFNPSIARNYQISVDPESSGRAVVQVFRGGERIATLEASNNGQTVNRSVFMDSEVVIVVYHYENYIENGSTSRQCFDVRVY